ncbi:SigE family RNA polymerase sigma factor [Streptomyces sp. 184]|uniref:SigE family RNA polymerase sigma factor n=1 Tax=Streptomyces sp. 184 TaxID=1827526 RepID=UPI0038926E3D
MLTSGVTKEGRDAEFQSFMSSRWLRLVRTAYLLTGEQHTAEDLAQTTLERTYVAWRRVSKTDDPDAYVRRILINTHARRFRGRRGVEVPAGSASDASRPHPPERDRIAQADDREVLLRALVELPPRQRQAVVLRYWEDLSVGEAAAAMGCSTGTVKSQAAKGLAKLRQTPTLSGLIGVRSETGKGSEK